jgi:hypothetical protein
LGLNSAFYNNTSLVFSCYFSVIQEVLDDYLIFIPVWVNPERAYKSIVYKTNEVLRYKYYFKPDPVDLLRPFAINVIKLRAKRKKIARRFNRF